MASYLDSKGITYIFDVLNNQWWNSKEATLPKTSFVIDEGLGSSVQKDAVGVRSLGRSSVASGKHTVAHGDYSFAGGEYSNAIGRGSVAMAGQVSSHLFTGDANDTLYHTDIPNVFINHILGAHLYVTQDSEEYTATIVDAVEGGNGLDITTDVTLSDAGLIDQPIFITSNMVKGDGAVSFGNNFIDGSNSFAVGTYNIEAGDTNITHGYYNLNYGDCNFVSGDTNSVMGYINTVFGCENQLISDENSVSEFNTIFGTNNIVEGSYNIATGDNNTIQGASQANSIFGSGHYIDNGNVNFLSGDGHYIDAVNGNTLFGFGNHAINNAMSGFASGAGLCIKNEYETTFGKYNKSNLNDSYSGRTLFSIGVGSETTPEGEATAPGEGENAIEVMQNGDIWLGGYGSTFKLWDHKNKTSDFVSDIKSVEGHILEGSGDIDLESIQFKGFVDVESGTEGIDAIGNSMRIGDVAFCMGVGANGDFGGQLHPDFFRIADYTDEDLEKFKENNLLPLYFANEFAYMEAVDSIFKHPFFPYETDPETGEKIYSVPDYKNLTKLSPLDIVMVAKMNLAEVLGATNEIEPVYKMTEDVVEYEYIDDILYYFMEVNNGELPFEPEVLDWLPTHMYVPYSVTATPMGKGLFDYNYRIKNEIYVDNGGISESVKYFVDDHDFLIVNYYDKRGRVLTSQVLDEVGKIKSKESGMSQNFVNYSSSITSETDIPLTSFGLSYDFMDMFNDPDFVSQVISQEVPGAYSIGFSFASYADLCPYYEEDYIQNEDEDIDGNIFTYDSILPGSPVVFVNEPSHLSCVKYKYEVEAEYLEKEGEAKFDRENTAALYYEMTGEEIPDDLNNMLPKYVYTQSFDTATHIVNRNALSDWNGIRVETPMISQDDYIAISASKMKISKKPNQTIFVKVSDAEKSGMFNYYGYEDFTYIGLTEDFIFELTEQSIEGPQGQMAINLTFVKESEITILDSWTEDSGDGEYTMNMGAITSLPEIPTHVYYSYLKPTAESLSLEIPVLFCKVIRTSVLEVLNFLKIAKDFIDHLGVMMGGSEGSSSDTEVISNVIESVLTLIGLGVGEFLTSGSFMYMDDILDIFDEFMEDIDNGNVAPPPSNSGDGIAGMIAKIMWILSYFAPRLIERIPEKIENNIMISGMNGVVEMIQVAMSLNNPLSPAMAGEFMDQIMGDSFAGEVGFDEARDFLINGLPDFMQNEVYPLVSKIYGLIYTFNNSSNITVDDWHNSLDQNFIEYINMVDSDNHNNRVDPVDVCNQMGYSGDGKIILNDGYVGYNQDFEFKGFRNGKEIYNGFNVLKFCVFSPISEAGFEDIMQPFDILLEIGGYLMSCVEAVGNNPIYICKYPIRDYLYLIIHAMVEYTQYVMVTEELVFTLINKIKNNFPLMMINNPNGAGMIISDQWTLDLLEKYLSPTAPDSEAILNIWQNSERLPISDIINIIFDSITDESLKLSVMVVSPYTMTARMDPSQELTEYIYSYIYELIKLGAADRIAFESEMNMVNAQQEVNFAKLSTFLIENGEIYESGEVGDFEISTKVFINTPYEFEQLISQSNKNIQPIALEDMLEYPQGEMVTVANAWTENKLLSELPVFETNEETGEDNRDELNILNNLEIDLDAIKSLPTLSSSYTISLPTLNDERLIKININIDENSNISNMVIFSDLLLVPFDDEEILYKDENGEFVLSDKIINPLNTLNRVLSCNKSIYLDVRKQETGEHITEEDMSVLDNIFKVTIAHELDPKLYIKGVSGWNEVASAHEPTPVEDILDII